MKKNYINRFYHLLESEIGTVNPIIMEQPSYSKEVKVFADRKKTKQFGSGCQLISVKQKEDNVLSVKLSCQVGSTSVTKEYYFYCTSSIANKSDCSDEPTPFWFDNEFDSYLVTNHCKLL
jgi:hypothetical protein